MGARPFLGDSFGRNGNNFYRACAIFPVLPKMASEKNSVVVRYKLGSQSNGNSSRSMRGGGKVGTVFVTRSDGPAGLPRACVSILKWLKSIKT